VGGLLMILALIPMGVLSLGLMDMPYGYYTLLRFVVCFFGFGFAAFLFERDNKTWMLMALWGIIYNPFIPIYLSRDIWFPINIVTICSFAYMIPLLQKHSKEEKQKVQQQQIENRERLKTKFEERESLKKKTAFQSIDSSKFDPEREQYLQNNIQEFGIKTSPKTGKFLKKKKSEITSKMLVSMARIYSYKFDRGIGNFDSNWSKFYPDEIMHWVEQHFDKDVCKELENAENVVQDMWQYLMDNYGDTHPSGEHHEFGQNYRREKVELGARLHFRAVLEQARRLGLEDTLYHIPAHYRKRLDKTEDLPTPLWEK
jgi:hypothetical protein